MDPAADGSPLETSNTTPPGKILSTSVHVWLWIFLGAWVVSFFLPAVSIMGNKPGRGWETARAALILFFVPVKGAWLIFIPGIWLVWVNLFMLIAPFEMKQIERGQARVFTALFSIATAITIVIAYIPILSWVTGFQVGFYLWAFSLIATAGLFARNLWRNLFARLPSVCLVGLLLALPVHRGEVDFLPAPRKPGLESKPAAVPQVRFATVRLVASSPGPSLVGDPLTFTVTISTNGGGVPTGTVDFTDENFVIGRSAVAAGEATFSTHALKTGAHFISATYTSDGTTGSYLTGRSQVLIQLVNDPTDAGTSTMLTLVRQDPGTRPNQVSFTLKAKVTTIGSTVPTGRVIIMFMYGARIPLRLEHNGEATLSRMMPAKVFRGYEFQAIYCGGGGFQSSSSTLAVQ